MDWRLLVRQFWALITLSMRRMMLGRTVWVALLLSAFPMVIAVFAVMMMGIGLSLNSEVRAGLEGQLPQMIQRLFSGGFLHFVIVFSAMDFSSNAMRQENDDQTLHYLYLSTLPRWLIVPGKMAAYLLLTTPVYILAFSLSKFLVFLPLGSTEALGRFLAPMELLRLAKEAAVLLAASAVYAALFLTTHLVFKNPLHAVMIYCWELVANMFGDVLSNFSMVTHLKALLPHATSEKPMFVGILAEGPSTLQALLVLPITFVACLLITSFVQNQRQCLYS